MQPRENEANAAPKSILDDEYMRKKQQQKENAEDFLNSLDSLRIYLFTRKYDLRQKSG